MGGQLHARDRGAERPQRSHRRQSAERRQNHLDTAAGVRHRPLRAVQAPVDGRDVSGRATRQPRADEHGTDRICRLDRGDRKHLLLSPDRGRQPRQRRQPCRDERDDRHRIGHHAAVDPGRGGRHEGGQHASGQHQLECVDRQRGRDRLSGPPGDISCRGVAGRLDVPRRWCRRGIPVLLRHHRRLGDDLLLQGRRLRCSGQLLRSQRRVAGGHRRFRAGIARTG